MQVGDEVRYQNPRTGRMQSGVVVKEYSDGDVVVNFGGHNDVSIDPELLHVEDSEIERLKLELERQKNIVRIMSERLSQQEELCR